MEQIGRLRVKLRGRMTTPAGRRGRTIYPSARGAKPTTPHGPLQRLLGAVVLHTLFNALIQLLELVYKLVAARLCPKAKHLHI